MPARSIAPSNSVYRQFSLVAQSCLTLCDPMDYSTPGFPAHHQLPEPTQTPVHSVGDAIQPSHPLIPFSSCLQSFSESGSFLMGQFFTSGGQSTGASAAASVLPRNSVKRKWGPTPVFLTGKSHGQRSLVSYKSKGLQRVRHD